MVKKLAAYPAFAYLCTALHGSEKAEFAQGVVDVNMHKIFENGLKKLQ